MKCLQTVASVVLLALCLHMASAEIVNTQKCPDEVADKCTIHHVSIRPCPEAAEGSPCTFNRSSNITITFDYTPEFYANNLTSDALLVYRNFKHSLPFFETDKKACQSTSCPLIAGLREVYVYEFINNITLHERMSQLEFKMMWKLTSENKDQCCFMVPIVFSSNPTNT
ncbi:ecdysteroid-regulated 16 kDa protein-like [Anopheles moucheti]|uniref:ecdysteroid-regulated 16 kDa protein-like n=1 Tax=Anopheles moucheti TaxID=186751 RepID=UPI0022F131A1|nr:ecdysteroid-regulated 16 kDa protein-like [Anopheles moucheti]